MLGLHQNEKRSCCQIHWGVVGYRLILELLFTLIFFFFQSKDEILIYYKTRQIIEIRVPGRFHRANYLGKDMLLAIFWGYFIHYPLSILATCE